MESISIRKKLGCAVRQENACLTMQDEQHICDTDVMHYELATSKSQVWQSPLHCWYSFLKMLHLCHICFLPGGESIVL